MSSALEDVRAVLVGAAGVTALVAQRIYPSQAPQGAAAPFVVLRRISDVPQHAFTNTVADRLTNARVQVDCYAKKYVDADAIAKAIETALDALPGPDLHALREDARDLYDDEAQLHCSSADYSVWR